MTTLRLTLSEKPFEVMVTGEKVIEYRRQSQWIRSRLFDKKGEPRVYDKIEFVNGYGKDRPRFTVTYNGFSLVNSVNETFSNGLCVVIDEPVYAIRCSPMIEPH